MNIYYLIQNRLQTLINTDIPEMFKSHEVRGWLRPYNQRFGFYSYFRLSQIQYLLDHYLFRLQDLKRDIHSELKELLIGSAADEFIFDTIEPTLLQLQQMNETVKKGMTQRIFSKRSFNFTDNTQNISPCKVLF